MLRNIKYKVAGEEETSFSYITQVDRAEKFGGGTEQDRGLMECLYGEIWLEPVSNSLSHSGSPRSCGVEYFNRSHHEDMMDVLLGYVPPVKMIIIICICT